MSIEDIDDVLKEMKKSFKGDEDCPIKKGTDKQPNVPFLQTGSIALDKAIGIGGLPQGRIVEIYGPEASGKTTVTLGMIAQAQRDGHLCAFLDMEHALTPDLATGCGVDMSKLIFSQPNYGEQCLEFASKLISTGKVSMVVIDSVAAMTPKAELDGEMEDNQIGAQARMIGKGVRKLTAAVSKTNCILIFINQIREKVGVMFGCLHSDNMINFVNGESKTIKEVVDNKIEGKVWSFDNEKGFIASDIIDWHNNGNVVDRSDYLSINIKGPGNKNGRMNITVTPDHEVLTDHGFVKAENLFVGDRLVTKQPTLMSGSYGKFLSGILSGDSHVSNQKGHLNSCLVMRDNVDIDYMKWKIRLLSGHAGVEFKASGDKYITFTSNQYSELTQLKEKYPNRDPNVLFDNFSWLGFAIWIMDDACYNRGRYTLSIKRFKGNYDKIDDISNRLDAVGLWHHKSYGGSITFDKDTSDMISENICDYVPKCMSHKVPNKYYNRIGGDDLKLIHEGGYSVYYPEVVSIRSASSNQIKSTGKYDITIDNECHNYMAGGEHNGVIVHNSPEVTPGGKAIKFASSIRLEVKRKESIKDSKKTIGNNLRIKVIKNKVAMPGEAVEVDLYFGKGIDNSKDFIAIAVELGIVEKRGSFLIYGEIRGNGSANFLEEVKKAKVYNEIEEKTRSKMIEFGNVVTVENDDQEGDFDDDQT